jgi:o-succinylbenzoate synthase
MTAEQTETPDGRLATVSEVSCPLRLRQAEVFLVSLPMIRTLWSAYGRTLADRKRLIVVRLEDTDGIVGWGEAPIAERPVYCADTAESTWSALTGLLVPGVLARDLAGPADATLTWADLLGQSYAKNAMETAIWAIVSARLGVPLARLWGGVRDAVPVGESFGRCERIDDLLEQVETRMADGFGRIKLKIAPGWDVGPARAVSRRFPGVPLSVDANCGYSPAADGPWADLDALGLVMIEQPYAADALLALARLQGRLATPLCLDESAASLLATETALYLQAGKVVNIKPPRLGGPLSCIAVHDLCVSRGVPAWCGGTLETGIGRGFNLALAALPGFRLHSDMSPARIFYEQDLVEPTFDVRPDGCIDVPRRPGNGFEVAAGRVTAAAIRRWSSDTDS